MPDIDNINDEIEFDIEKYKKNLNYMNNSKIEEFKKIFEEDIKNMIEKKSTIIKNNISQFLLNTQIDQENQLKSIEEEINFVKKDFNEVIKNHNDLIGNLGDLFFKQEGEKNKITENEVGNQNAFAGGDAIYEEEEVDDDSKNKDLNMIKFDEEEIKHEINIKKANCFYIDNIAITNLNKNKDYDPLYFSIDTNRSSKNLLFLDNSKNNKYQKYHRLTLNGPLKDGEKLNNAIDLHFQDPKIGEYALFIYVKENPNDINLSKPLKITINITEDPEK
jgi:hypothetical protein